MLALHADRAVEDLPDPEVVVVPGGPCTRHLMQDSVMLDWPTPGASDIVWTTSVCTGSLLLAAAGILDGLEATSHWWALEILGRYGARPVSRRVVAQGKVIT